ncbi:MAG: Gfo/Idh/MocA family oxidoreductase [Puniceicoccales bacterium]|jgi:predicted dehydrogenase|nr:Gfo/Idh/MocA family oxidoreductase [Puniceicoccales bacterium]
MEKNTPLAFDSRRRSFIKGILATGTFPFLASITPPLFAADKEQSPPKKATQKVRIAYIGIGNQGAGDIVQFEKTGLTKVVALCDTESAGTRTAGIRKRFPKVPFFQDFRQMFDKVGNQIDAVLVATPDFSHFPATILAMSLGKHVYVEKPMAHSFLQTELLIAAEKKYKVVTQMGNQGHSEANYFQFKAWTEAGVIKNITKINAHMNSIRRWHKPKFLKLKDYFNKEDIPAWLDWNAWLATALDHKFNRGYLNGEWRCWYDFGNGALGDWGAHIFDTAHEFLRLGLPTAIDAVKIEGHSPFIFPQASTLAFKFPARGPTLPPLTLTWYDGQKNIPPLPKNAVEIDVDGSIPPPGGVSSAKARGPKAPNNGKEIYSSDGITFQGGSHKSTLRILEKDKASQLTLPVVPKSPSNHYKNFLLAVLGKEKTRSPFSVAGTLCETMVLGVIAQRVNANLVFDPVKKQITNHGVANTLLNGVPPRKGWEQFYKL